MIENSTSNNIENEEFKMNSEQCDYKKLINRLKEIKQTITLVEQTIFK